jgi:hypothetical protein
MLFLMYWELNENRSSAENIQAAQKLTGTGLFPPEGVNIIRWDMTADNWGILLAEAETAADMHRAIGMWRAAGAGFFKVTKTSPAMPVQEEIPMIAEMLQAMA